MIMDIKEIIKMPKVMNNVHESSYRTWGILEYVEQMVSRGDSKETILEIIKFMKYYPEKSD